MSRQFHQKRRPPCLVWISLLQVESVFKAGNDFEMPRKKARSATSTSMQKMKNHQDRLNRRSASLSSLRNHRYLKRVPKRAL